MTIVDNRTSNLNLPLPAAVNKLSDDVARLIAAINGIDASLASTLASLSGKASAAHSHAIGDTTGLQAALDQKIGTGTNLPISQVTDLQGALDARAPVNNASLTGAPTAAAASVGDNSTRIATTGWVRLQAYLTVVPDGAVVTAKIGDLAVTSAKLANSAVIAGKLADGAVDTTARLADSIVTFAKMAAAAIASAAEFISNTASKVLTPAAVWSAAAPIAITDSATITPNMATFINATVAKTINGTLANPDNPKPGQAGFIVFTQDGVGDKTQAFGANWKNVGSKTSLQTGVSKKTRLDYSVVSTGEIHFSLTWVP